MKIIKVAQPVVGREEVEAVGKVLLSGRYISGARVREFEEEFAKYIGARYAVAVNSGTAALHIALTVLGIGPGDEVVVPPLTFFSTVSVVLYQDAIPVFADIDKMSYCLDPQDLEKKITKNTKAVIPVHLYGNSADMSSIMQIARRYKLKVIEDVAQAHGTEYKAKKVGSIGDIGCFSFFATKHMTTGEGGMLATNNRKYADLAKIIRNHGMVDRDHHNYLGYNYRMTEMEAAIGLVQLRKLDDLNERRIKNSLYLIKELEKANIGWITLPHLDKHIKHTFFWCPIIVDEELLGMSTRELITLLRKRGIEVRHRYWEPLYRQRILVEKSRFLRNHYLVSRNIDYAKIYLKNAEKIAGKIIGLPNHPKLRRGDLDYIVDILTTIKRASQNA